MFKNIDPKVVVKILQEHYEKGGNGKPLILQAPDSIEVNEKLKITETQPPPITVNVQIPKEPEYIVGKPNQKQKPIVSNEPFILSSHNDYGRTNAKPTLEVLKLLEPIIYKPVEEKPYVPPPPDVVDAEGYILLKMPDGTIRKSYLLSKDNNYGVVKNLNNVPVENKEPDPTVENELPDLDTAPFTYAHTEPANTNYDFANIKVEDQALGVVGSANVAVQPLAVGHITDVLPDVEVSAEVDLLSDPSVTPTDFMSTLGQIANITQSDLALIQGLYIGIKAANALSNFNTGAKLEVSNQETTTDILSNINRMANSVASTANIDLVDHVVVDPVPDIDIALNIGQQNSGDIAPLTVIDDLTNLGSALNINAEVQTSPITHAIDPLLDVHLPSSLPTANVDVDISTSVIDSEHPATDLIEITNPIDLVNDDLIGNIQDTIHPTLETVSDILSTDIHPEAIIEVLESDISNTEGIENPGLYAHLNIDQNIAETTTNFDDCDCTSAEDDENENTSATIDARIDITKLNTLLDDVTEALDCDTDEEALVEEVSDLYSLGMQPRYTTIQVRDFDNTVSTINNFVDDESTPDSIPAFDNKVLGEYIISTLYPNVVTDEITNNNLFESLNTLNPTIQQQEINPITKGQIYNLRIPQTVHHQKKNIKSTNVDRITSIKPNPLLQNAVSIDTPDLLSTIYTPLKLANGLEVFDPDDEETFALELSVNNPENGNILKQPIPTLNTAANIDLLNPITLNVAADVDTSKILNTKLIPTDASLINLDPDLDLSADIVASLGPNAFVGDFINAEKIPIPETSKWREIPTNYHSTLSTNSIPNSVSPFLHKSTADNYLQATTAVPNLIKTSEIIETVTPSLDNSDLANVDISELGLINAGVNLDLLTSVNPLEINLEQETDPIYKILPGRHPTSFEPSRKTTKVITSIKPTTYITHIDPSSISPNVMKSTFHPSGMVSSIDPNDALLNIKLNALDNGNNLNQPNIDTPNIVGINLDLADNSNPLSKSRWHNGFYDVNLNTDISSPLSDVGDIANINIEAFQSVFEPTEVFSTIVPVDQTANREPFTDNIRHVGNLANLNIALNLNEITSNGKTGEATHNMPSVKPAIKVNKIKSTFENIAQPEEILTTNHFITTELPGNTAVNIMDKDLIFGKKIMDNTKEFFEQKLLNNEPILEANYKNDLEIMLPTHTNIENNYGTTVIDGKLGVSNSDNFNQGKYQSTTLPNSKVSSAICPIQDILQFIENGQHSTYMEQKPKSCRHIDETAVKGNLYFIGDGMKIPISMTLNEYGNIDLTLDMVNVCDDKSKLKIESQNNCDPSKCLS